MATSDGALAASSTRQRCATLQVELCALQDWIKEQGASGWSWCSRVATRPARAG